MSTFCNPKSVDTANRDFAVSFANCVTVFSVQEFNWVARRGRYGIFELMHLLAPKVTKKKMCVLEPN